MIENIRQEFVQILKESDWLDNQSKQKALAKVIYNYSSSSIKCRTFIYLFE
jgi:hypothetical protein